MHIMQSECFDEWFRLQFILAVKKKAKAYKCKACLDICNNIMEYNGIKKMALIIQTDYCAWFIYAQPYSWFRAQRLITL